MHLRLQITADTLFIIVNLCNQTGIFCAHNRDCTISYKTRRLEFDFVNWIWNPMAAADFYFPITYRFVFAVSQIHHATRFIQMEWASVFIERVGGNTYRRMMKVGIHRFDIETIFFQCHNNAITGCKLLCGSSSTFKKFAGMPCQPRIKTSCNW